MLTFARRSLMLFVLACGAPASAQDALRGKRYYLDTARLTGASVSCVDCHRGLPPGLFGIGRAANDPAIIANAIASIPQMAPLRGRLTTQDIADVAAYIGNPGVASPQMNVVTRSPGGSTNTDRLDFGIVLSGDISGRATVHLRNDGVLPLRLISSARILGPQAGEFALLDATCQASSTLAAAASCEIGIAFHPAIGATGLRSAAVQVDHDWVGSTAAVALIGTAEATAAVPPISTSGGGGLLAGWLLLVMALAVVARDRLREQRRWLPFCRRWSQVLLRQ